jgi:phage terminase large subunit-like protein
MAHGRHSGDPSSWELVVCEVSEHPPRDLPASREHLPVDVEAFKNWKPEAQQKALELLRQHEGATWRPFYCPNLTCDGKPHGEWDWEHARPDQRPPRWRDDWLTLLLSGGRGSGKTRTGSEITHRVTNITPRITLLAATGPDLRDTMVEGVSGVLATSPPGKRPLWEPSKKKLTWPNGCIGQGFSAEEPDRLRGPQSGFTWADEPAHYPLINEVWDNMLFGLRIGKNPKVIATSTPKPTKWMRALINDPLTVVHRVSTYENLNNLADTFKRTILDRYEGTRLGKQELHGEVLEDVEGALWAWDMYEWVEEAPHLIRIVVAVDPAGTANKKSDETGIVVLGIGEDKCIYVLADYTGRYSPGQWGDKVIDAYVEFSADDIVAEKNYGGEMVAHVIETSAEKRGVPIGRPKLVDSRRGKALRAEPIVALYEKKRVKHVGKRGDLAMLEDEQTTWVPGEGDSPNRVDACVHGATALAHRVMPSTVADPNKLLSDRRAPTNRHLRAV